MRLCDFPKVLSHTTGKSINALQLGIIWHRLTGQIEVVTESFV